MEKNNLATIEYARGNIEQALSILEPYLETDSTVESPYTLGLAAQLYAQLGRRNEAERLLKQAVKAFQKKLPYLREEGIDPYSWYEYTVQFIRAAGVLGDHRRVIDLYKKYERYHVSWVTLANLYRNIGEYEPALRILKPLADIMPEEPVVMINLAGLYVESGQ